jgi:hypothetical protein
MRTIDSEILQLKVLLIQFEKNNIERLRIIARLNYTLGAITALTFYFILFKTSLLLVWPSIKLIAIKSFAYMASHITTISTSGALIAGSVSSATGVIIGAIAVHDNLNKQIEKTTQTPESSIEKSVEHIPENPVHKTPEQTDHNRIVSQPLPKTVTLRTILGEEYSGTILNRNENSTTLMMSSGDIIEIRNEEILELLFNGD